MRVGISLKEKGGMDLAMDGDRDGDADEEILIWHL